MNRKAAKYIVLIKSHKLFFHISDIDGFQQGEIVKRIECETSKEAKLEVYCLVNKEIYKWKHKGATQPNKYVYYIYRELVDGSHTKIQRTMLDFEGNIFTHKFTKPKR